ncbi:MAG: RNA repair transcriptional activator RtcR [Zoogloeaceae bacterium]|nr:RNA repair transcriptional activator RtcR [Zoogloeaceae bacterium]
MKNTVVLGFLGTKLDAIGGIGPRPKPERWKKWRPSVGLCQQTELPIHRLELLHDPLNAPLARKIQADIGEISPATTVRLVALPLVNPWDFEEVYTQLYEFSRHYDFDVENEDYLAHITTGTHVAQICWFLLTEARHVPGRLVQTAPRRNEAGERQARPEGYAEIIDLDLSRYDQIIQRFRREQADTVSRLKAGIATKNAAFNTMIEEIERVAGRSKSPILLTGPTGAGKSFLARRIHELKQERQRLAGRFVEINCATLRGESAMSALFGHVKGAFTGAQTARAGLLRAADGGVLFLDEIGELGLDEQAMLLKAIEEKRFLPFGGDEETTSDFQLIAGTHRNLRQRVREGRFREDLYARINLWTFALPALAERPEDIEPNLEYELERHAREQGAGVRFHAEARRRYLDFATAKDALWPGNFRELNSSLIRLATLAEKGRVTTPDVEREIARLRADWQNARGTSDAASTAETDIVKTLLGKAAADALDLFDRCQLETVLEICRRAKTLSDAGRTLFFASRQQKKQVNDADRLRKYLLRFGLDWEKISLADIETKAQPSVEPLGHLTLAVV